MKRDRILALAMLAVEAAAFAWYSRDDAYGYVLTALGAVAVFGGLRYQAVARTMPGIVAVLAVLFILYGLWGPTQVQLGEALLSYRVTHTAAQFWMAVQCAYLFARWERIPPLFLLAGMLSLTFMGDFRVLEQKAFPYQAAAAAIVLLAVLMAARPGRAVRGDLVRHGLALVGVVGGIGAGMAVFAYQNQLERLLSDLAPSVVRQSTGFSDQSHLNSVQRIRRLGDEDVMLRVTGDAEISYFVGKAFEYYSAEQWHASTEATVTEPVPAPSWMDVTETFTSDTVFRLSGAESDELATSIVTPDWSLEDTLFRPMGAAYLRTMGWPVEVDLNDSGNFIRSYPGEPYLVYVGPGMAPPADPEVLLRVPRELDKRVLEMGARVIEGAESETERVERIVAFMRDNYRYAGGGDAPREQEPISHFLLDRRAGSCEYFASSTVMFLRMAGIPCRYVTGFLVVERQAYGGYRLARSRDAHAWVEAYLEDGGWRIIDTTPEEGRPGFRESTYSTYVLDTFRQMRREIGALFSAQGAQDVWVWLQTNGARVIRLFVSLWPLWLGAAAVAAIIVMAGRLFRRNWRRRRKQAAGGAHPLTALVLEAERRSARGGFVRASHETLHGFADRIAAASPANGDAWAAWFRAAGDARYAFSPQDGRIAESAGALRQSLPGKPPRRAGGPA